MKAFPFLWSKRRSQKPRSSAFLGIVSILVGITLLRQLGKDLQIVWLQKEATNIGNMLLIGAGLILAARGLAWLVKRPLSAEEDEKEP